MKATSLFRSPAVAGLLGVLLSCSHRSTPVSGGGRQHPPIKKPMAPITRASDPGGPAMSTSISGGGSGTTSGGPIPAGAGQVRSFTDPRTGEVYDIVDGLAIVQFKDSPAVALLNNVSISPNAFDPDEASSRPDPIGDPYFLQAAEISSFIASTGVTVIAQWPGLRAIGVILPEGTTVEQAMTTWPDLYTVVDSVDPDPCGTLFTAPNDPYYSFASLPDDPNNPGLGYAPYNGGQWYLYPWSSNLYSANVEPAWDVTPGSSSVYVAVVDTGVIRNHPDLVDGSQILSWGVDVLPRNGDHTQPRSADWTQGGGQPYAQLASADSLMGHGTCVAGIISAAKGNGIGVAGISPAKIFPTSMPHYYDEIDYIWAIYAVLTAKDLTRQPYPLPGHSKPAWLHYNIEIVNLSVGLEGSSSAELHHTVELVVAVLGRFTLVCAAAGNSGSPCASFPANVVYPVYAPHVPPYKRCLAVMANDADGSRSVWGGTPQGTASNYWTDVDISAPGNWVYTIDMLGPAPPSYGPPYSGLTPLRPPPLDWFPNNYRYNYGFRDYCGFSGTSASAPIVAGVAALVQAQHPDWTPVQVWNKITSTMRPNPHPGLHPWDPLWPTYGGIPGYVNALAAVQ